MIYLKRFCFAIVGLLAVSLMTISNILLLITFPLTGLIYYVFTGNDPIKTSLLTAPVNIMVNFLDWYEKKFGPKEI